MPTKKAPARTVKPKAAAAAAAAKRKPGRPARLTREDIIDKTMEMLATCDVDDFKIKSLAEELKTVSMAIYNYFSSREELLEVVADEVCLLFKLPKAKAGDTWQ